MQLAVSRDVSMCSASRHVIWQLGINYYTFATKCKHMQSQSSESGNDFGGPQIYVAYSAHARTLILIFSRWRENRRSTVVGELIDIRRDGSPDGQIWRTLGQNMYAGDIITAVLAVHRGAAVRQCRVMRGHVRPIKKALSWVSSAFSATSARRTTFTSVNIRIFYA